MNKTNNSRWAGAIRVLREKKNMTQKDLAQALGIEVVTVNRWEKGTSSPTGSSEMLLKTLLASEGISLDGAAGFMLGATGEYAILNIAPFLGALGVTSEVLAALLNSKKVGDDTGNE